MKRLSFILFFAFCQKTQATGGITAGGGGDVFICAGSNTFGFKTRSQYVFLADTFDVIVQAHDNFKYSKKRIKPLPPSRYLEALSATLQLDRPEFQQMFTRFLDLNFVPVPSVPEFDDDNIDLKSIPSGCTKHQLAIQDLSKKIVYFNPTYYLKLSPMEQALFKIHEALVSLRGYPAPTNQIRLNVHNILTSELFIKVTEKIIKREFSVSMGNQDVSDIVYFSCVASKVCPGGVSTLEFQNSIKEFKNYVPEYFSSFESIIKISLEKVGNGSQVETAHYGSWGFL